MHRSMGFSLAILCLISLSTLTAVLAASSAHADAETPEGGEPLAPIPTTISVQGRLTDSSGEPLPAGPKSFTFRIFSDPSGPTQVWPVGGSEVQVITTGVDGLWIALIGALNPLTDAVFSDTLRWLGIDVDGTVMPRVRLVSGPYAFRVATVDGAFGGHITSKVTIGPGQTNTGSQAFVAGSNNAATGGVATISGGSSHLASGNWSTIAGGSNDTASGQYSMVGGGRRNVAAGVLSFAAGFRAHALHDGSFVWGDSTNADFASTAPNQFLIRAAGGVGIGTNAPDAPLHVQEGSAGTVTANASSSLVLERNSINYLSILSPDHVSRGVYFGDPDDPNSGGVFYASSTEDGLDFRTNGNTTRMVIDSLGNVGIGTTLPNAKLHVNGAVQVGGTLNVATSTGALVVPRMLTSQRDALTAVQDGMIIYNLSTDQFNFRENGVWVTK